MNRRYELQEKLEGIMASRVRRPEEYVYFQPSESVKLKYPCIMYSLTRVYVRHADNAPFIGKDQYTVTVVDRDPDSQIAKEILNTFRYVSFDRRYVADNLYHDVLTLYY